jgi:hypothetical protein
MEDTSREIAFMLDEDGVTTEELQEVMQDMAEGIKAGNDGQTMVDNYYTLKQAGRELDYWEGTAAEHEVAPAPAPLSSKIYIIDENRKGIAREQVLQVAVDVLDVMGMDLESNGFCKVATIVDESVSSRSSVIFYKPAHSEYIKWEEHVDIVGTVLSVAYRSEEE